MARIVRWFERGISLRNLVVFILLIFALKTVLWHVSTYIALLVYDAELFGSRSREVAKNLDLIGPVYGFFCTVVIDPAYEEFLFRFIPLLLVISLLRYLLIERTQGGAILVLAVAFWTSVVFGEVHGPGHYMVEGPSGILYSMIFLKVSKFGLESAHGWLATTGIHGLWNATNVYAVPMLRDHLSGA